MVGSLEKAVKGGTKVKLAAPKAKYVEHILVATHDGEAGVAGVFRALKNRLRDSTWTIVFKSLIIVHLMIREGEPDVTLKFIAENPGKLATSHFPDVQLQGLNIRYYLDFLRERIRAFKDTKVDFVRNGEGRLKRSSVEKGLLRETEAVQTQIAALLKCDFLSNEPDNEITLTAFRLLVTDLLALFYVMNEGVINMLEHFFEMSKFDAGRALAIYKTFSRQTNKVVEYLAVARQFEHATRLEVPRLKHAPTSLTGSLEEYTHDPDFEINRRQYIAQQEAKKGASGQILTKKPFPIAASKTTPSSRVANGRDFPSPKITTASIPAPPTKSDGKGPGPDLIDFFESIEQNQQPMANAVSQVPPQQSYAQQPTQTQIQTGQLIQAQPQQFPQIDPLGQMPNFTQQPRQPYPSPFSQPGYSTYGLAMQQQQLPSQQATPIQAQYTGAGFGGYTPQPQQAGPQPTVATFDNTIYQQQQLQQQPQQQTNGIDPMTTGQTQMTNPFRRSMMPTGAATVASMLPQSTASTTISPIGRQNTNPFTRGISQPTSPEQQQQQQQQQQQATFVNSPINSASQATSFMSQSQAQQEPKSLVPQTTGTNPFARHVQAAPTLHQQAFMSAQPLVANVTGSTNPFRASVFQNPQTGQGWQVGQGTMGGLEQLPTVPVFPRPGEPAPLPLGGSMGVQPQQQQQQHQQQLQWQQQQQQQQLLQPQQQQTAGGMGW